MIERPPAGVPVLQGTQLHTWRRRAGRRRAGRWAWRRTGRRARRRAGRGWRRRRRRRRRHCELGRQGLSSQLPDTEGMGPIPHPCKSNQRSAQALTVANSDQGRAGNDAAAEEVPQVAFRWCAALAGNQHKPHTLHILSASAAALCCGRNRVVDNGRRALVQEKESRSDVLADGACMLRARGSVGPQPWA